MHGGVTVRVSSSDPTKFKVARLATDLGEPFVDISVANGLTAFNFFVQGIPGASGQATLTATSPLFTTDTATISVNTTRLTIASLAPSTTAASADDPFTVRTQVQNDNGDWTSGNVSASAGPLTVTVSSSDLAVAGLTTLSQTSTSPVTVTIAVNASTSPGTVAAGGVAFEPLGAGNVTVTATAPTFANGTQDVPVNP